MAAHKRDDGMSADLPPAEPVDSGDESWVFAAPPAAGPGQGTGGSGERVLGRPQIFDEGTSILDRIGYGNPEQDSATATGKAALGKTESGRVESGRVESGKAARSVDAEMGKAARSADGDAQLRSSSSPPPSVRPSHRATIIAPSARAHPSRATLELRRAADTDAGRTDVPGAMQDSPPSRGERDTTVESLKPPSLDGYYSARNVAPDEFIIPAPPRLPDVFRQLPHADARRSGTAAARGTFSGRVATPPPPLVEPLAWAPGRSGSEAPGQPGRASTVRPTGAASTSATPSTRGATLNRRSSAPPVDDGGQPHSWLPVPAPGLSIPRPLQKSAEEWLKTGTLRLVPTASARHARALQRALLLSLLIEQGYDGLPQGLQRRATWLFRAGWAEGHAVRDGDDLCFVLGLTPTAESREFLAQVAAVRIPREDLPPPSVPRSWRGVQL